MEDVLNKPLISYVVTTYNIEKFVEESIRSAFSQTYSPLEIVLSDDCSTDRTFEIIKELAEQYNGPHRIVLNRNEVNLGITKHMNKAYLGIATGEIIVAAHGDDVSAADRTEKSYEFLKAHPEFTAVSFSMEAVNENGTHIKGHSAVVDTIHTYTFEHPGNIPAPSRCFYKKVMEVFGPLNDDCPTEDELISFRALLLGKNAFLPDCLVKYRKHSNSSSNPENFSQFPLERILKQQDDDMLKAVNLGLITDEQRRKRYSELKRSMFIRQKYRKYYASRKWTDLLALILSNKVSIRRKCGYLKEHIFYLFIH